MAGALLVFEFLMIAFAAHHKPSFGLKSFDDGGAVHGYVDLHNASRRTTAPVEHPPHIV